MRTMAAKSRAHSNIFAAVGVALLCARCSGCDDGQGLDLLSPQIQVEPLGVDLGEVPMTVHAQQAITIRSVGMADLRLSAIRLEDNELFGIANQPQVLLQPSRSDVVLVSAVPSELGVYTGILVIESNDEETPVIRVPLRIKAIDIPPCDDNNACTTDVFDPVTQSCSHTFADGTPCEPADKCVLNAICSQGVCLGEPKICDDNSMCTRDLCRQTDGECIFLPNEVACDDGNPCTEDICLAEGCQYEQLPSGTPCDDMDECTSLDACFAGECLGNGAPDGSACDDHNSCTTGDTCFGGVCTGESIIDPAAEGDLVFSYPLTEWPSAFLHRREVSLGTDGSFFGLDHLRLENPAGLTHVIFSMNQCGSDVYEFAYRPPDTHVLVRYVRREMQLTEDNKLRVVVGVRQLPENGFDPQTTMYVLDETGGVQLSRIQELGGETGRSLLPDGSHIYGVIWPIDNGNIAQGIPSTQNLVIVREDSAGNVLWRHERSTLEWAEFLGVAGPRVLFWSSGRFAALDFNTGALVWSRETPFITKEMALSTELNLGIARAGSQLIAVELLSGEHVFSFPETPSDTYFPRTDPVIAADGRILVLMQRNAPDLTRAQGLEWVELTNQGDVLSTTPLPYLFPDDWGMSRHEDHDDPYPTVADDGVAYVGYGDRFFAIDPGGTIRWTLTSTIPNAFTGTVPLLREDGILLINETSRQIIGVRTNGAQMSDVGWASFRHDGRRTNFTP